MDFDCENIFVSFTEANIGIQKKIPFKFEQITIDTFTEKELNIICNKLKESFLYHPSYYDTFEKIKKIMNMKKEYKMSNNWQVQFEEFKNGKENSKWSYNQRVNYKSGNLSQERIKLLESVPEWCWEINLDKLWRVKFEELKSLKGRIPPRTPRNGNQRELSVWCYNQRNSYKKGELSGEKIKLLETLPEWIWENNLMEEWQIKYEELETLNGAIPSINEEQSDLRKWCHNQRLNYKTGKILQGEINLLESLPDWSWGDNVDELWREKFEKLKNCNGRIPLGVQKELILTIWCYHQRNSYKRRNLSEEKRDLLESLAEWYWQ